MSPPSPQPDVPPTGLADLVVYAAGGGMRGIFGVGALHALSELGARDRVHALYGISAGSFNIAHFALGSTTRAMEWYLHHVLTRGLLDGVTPVALLRGEDAIDMSETERVLETEHLLDGEALSHCAVPLYFGAVDRESLRFSWLDARRQDAIQVLAASSTVFPLVRDAVFVDGVPYLDGGFGEAICYRRLRGQHPDAKLILVLNDSEFESMVRRLTLGGVLRFLDERLAGVWMETVSRAPSELAEALADSRTLVLKPDEDFDVHFATTDSATLAHGFWLGYRSVLAQRDRVREFLGT